jgi:hypothetical protein
VTTLIIMPHMIANDPISIGISRSSYR